MRARLAGILGGMRTDGGSHGDVDVAEAHRAAQAGEALLLDVREDAEWALGHAPSAVHVPMGQLRQDSVPRDRPVLAVCRVGGRSAAVAEALAELGYDVRNVAGGMQAWQSAGLPVVLDDGRPGRVL
jgi:rhodanese-related sulfurtransferase